jgi:hypothetical protein
MTTIVLTHPNEHNRRFQIFAVYDAPDVHSVFAIQETGSREVAEQVAREMMENFEADHFRRVVEAAERIG